MSTTVLRSEAVVGGAAPALPRSRRWPLPAVAALGLGSLALYLVALVVSYPLPRYANRPLLDLGKIGGYGRADGVRFAATLALLWAAYLAAGALAPLVARYLRPVAYTGAALFSLALLGLYPITAADAFNYILYGLAQHRGANPLTTPPSAAIGPPLIGYSAWPDHPSPYGPLWQWLAFGVTGVTREWLLGGVLAFKLVFAACHLLNCALIERLAARIGAARPAAAVLLYGWNPLILYEAIGNAHNDIVMLTAILLALDAFARRGAARALALPFAAVGVLVKFVAALWLPPLALALWAAPPRRGRARRVLLGGIACAALAVAAYWAFWAGGQALLGVRRQADLYSTSFGGLAMIALVERRGLLPPRELLDLLKGAALAALALTLLLRRPRAGTVAGLPVVLFDLTVVYLLVGALWFQPWYLIPPLGLAPLLDTGRRAVATAYALGATGSYLVYFYVWPDLGWTPDRLLVQGLATAVAHGPALLTLGAVGAVSLWGRVVARRTGAARQDASRAPSEEIGGD